MPGRPNWYDFRLRNFGQGFETGDDGLAHRRSSRVAPSVERCREKPETRNIWIGRGS
jgi:hypothetical protein